jgi:adenylate cyclase
MADEDRAAARQLLLDLGATDEQLAAAEGRRDLQGFVSDLVLARGRDLSADDVAGRVGVDIERVVGLWRALGVNVDDPSAPLFTEEDLGITDIILNRGVFSDEKGYDVLRVVGTSLARVAEAVVAAYVQTEEAELEAAHASQLARVQRNLVATELGVAVGNGLGALFQHHLREAIDRQRLSQEGISRRELARVAVGFVDLVGFTSLSHRLDSRDLASLVTRFEVRAFDTTAARGGRVVKHIGDEVMFVALDAAAVCQIALDLTDAFTADGIEPRGGACAGEVLVQHGDYYGPVVNLASRLTDAAVPGEVLVDEMIAEAIASNEEVVAEPAGRRQLKGFDETVRVFTLGRASS